jgi:hypothetical protein
VSPNAKEETTKNNKSRHTANQTLNCYIHKAQEQKQQSLLTAIFPACLPLFPQTTVKEVTRLSVKTASAAAAAAATTISETVVNANHVFSRN